MTQLVQLFLLMLTVAQESGAEPYLGKLAVAFVVRNRVMKSGRSYSDVIMQRKHFSAWNEDSVTRMNIDDLKERQLAECMTAALAAMFLLDQDPTEGATFYLNKEEVIRINGKLPGWWESDTDPASEKQIGKHSFRKAKMVDTQRI